MFADNLESCSGRKARVFIVDDHPIVRRGLRILFGLRPDMVVCGEADNLDEALEKIDQFNPHLCVVDLVLKQGTGFDLIQRLRKTRPSVKILVFSMHMEHSMITRALEAGADALVAKDEGTGKVIETARSLLFEDTNSQCDPAGAAAAPDSTPSESDIFSSLTNREMEIFQLIGRGFSTRQIAEKLDLSFNTVASHRERIKHKLQLKGGLTLAHSAFHYLRRCSPGAREEE